MHYYGTATASYPVKVKCGEVAHTRMKAREFKEFSLPPLFSYYYI